MFVCAILSSLIGAYMNTEVSDGKATISQQVESWSQHGQKVAVKIVGNSGNTAQGSVYICNWSKADRVRRASMWCGIFWVVALFCVLIPILHFILVPLFLILGPVMAFRVYKQKSVILGGQGLCPRCEKELPIEKSQEVWPLSDLCTHCHNSVKIYLNEA